MDRTVRPAEIGGTLSPAPGEAGEELMNQPCAPAGARSTDLYYAARFSFSIEDNDEHDVPFCAQGH